MLHVKDSATHAHVPAIGRTSEKVGRSNRGAESTLFGNIGVNTGIGHIRMIIVKQRLELHLAGGNAELLANLP